MVYQNIKRYLEDNKINQTAIGQKIGLSKQIMSNAMNGKRKLSADEYLNLCKVLGVPADYFAD